MADTHHDGIMPEELYQKHASEWRKLAVAALRVIANHMQDEEERLELEKDD